MKKDLNELVNESMRLSPQKRAGMRRVPKKKTKCDRGFGYIYWRDQYWQECRLSESSLAEKACIWLGVDDQCMLLEIKQVAALAKLLNHFAENGELP